MFNRLWLIHWKLLKIFGAVSIRFDPGGHHFINGVCHCGQKGRWYIEVEIIE